MIDVVEDGIVTLPCRSLDLFRFGSFGFPEIIFWAARPLCGERRVRIFTLIRKVEKH